MGLACVAVPTLPALAQDAEAEPDAVDLKGIVDGTGILPPARVRFELHLGQRALDGGLYRRAVESFDKVTRSAPGHPGGWFLLSRALHLDGKIAEAREAALRAVAILDSMPADKQALFGIGRFHYQHGLTLVGTVDFEGAETAFRRALEVEPDFVEPRFQLAALELKLGRNQEAAASYAEALRQADSTADGWLGYSKALLRLDDFDGAQDALKRAVELAPDDPEIHYSLASLHRSRGDFDAQEEALANFERLTDEREEIKEDRTRVEESHGRAAVLMSEEKWDEAAALLNELSADAFVTERGFRQPRVLADLARCHSALGDGQAARRLYAESLELRPAAFTTNFDLGTLLVSDGEVHAGLSYLVRAAEADPFNPSVHVNLGLAHGLLGRLNDARAELRKAITLAPEDRSIQQRLVDLEWAMGNQREARRMVSRLGGGIRLPQPKQPTPAGQSR
ncbi:MAG: tetratricopeptide repeat protein [Acidobacteriota bacterium]